MSHPNQRIGLQVQYLTSGSHTAAGCALHFFQVVEQGRRAGAGGRPQKRILVLADRPTFLADVDVAAQRCVMISKIETMNLFEEHLRPITGQLTQYDVLVQMSSTLDIIRTIGSIFKPNDPAHPTPIYELEENQPIAARVNVRLSDITQDDAFARKQNDEALRRLREANSREVASLKEALQRQKDEQLHELVELHTQNEQLRHTLSQTENLLMESRRSAKEQRVGLLSQTQAFQADHGGPVGPRASPIPVRSPEAVTPPSAVRRLPAPHASPLPVPTITPGHRPASPARGAAISIYSGPRGLVIDDGDTASPVLTRSPGSVYPSGTNPSPQPQDHQQIRYSSPVPQKPALWSDNTSSWKI